MAFFKKLFSPIIWGNIIAMLAVVVLLLIGVWKGLTIYTRHGEGVAVPDVIGMMESDARYTLGRVGLEADVVDSAYNKTQPSGAILEQAPGLGSRVKEGRVIFLTVNAAQTPTLPIPDIADNCSRREAEAKLHAMGFKLGPVEYVPGDKDWVLGVKSRGRNVYTGERVPLDVPVVLQVGIGQDDPNDLDDGSDDWVNEADEIVTLEEEPVLEDFE